MRSVLRCCFSHESFACSPTNTSPEKGYSTTSFPLQRLVLNTVVVREPSQDITYRQTRVGLGRFVDTTRDHRWPTNRLTAILSLRKSLSQRLLASAFNGRPDFPPLDTPGIGGWDPGYLKAN